jgi:hypothetical protein
MNSFTKPSSDLRCPRCSATVQANQSFCGACGAPQNAAARPNGASSSQPATELRAAGLETAGSSTFERPSGPPPPSGFEAVPGPGPIAVPMQMITGAPTLETIQLRDRMIGIAGWVAVGCALLTSIGALLIVVADLTHHAIAGVDVSDSFGFLAQILTMLAAGFAGAAFLGSSRARSRRIIISAVGLALSFFAGCVAFAVLGGIFASHHLPGSLTASIIVSAVAAAVATATFVTAGTAFAGRAWGSSPERDGRLAVAAFIFVSAMVLAIASDVLALIAGANLGFDGSTTTAAGFSLAANLIEVGAGVTVAVAFVGSVSRMRTGRPTWRRHRDRLLAGGVSGLAFAYAFLSVSSFIQAGQGEFVPGLTKAGRWLVATGDLTVIGALACAAAAFFISGWRKQ